jgi:pSer/pThr/pTyr-binding forkhead associated (FHA) protein
VLECVARCWTVLDDGLSRDGTFVNGARVLARQRLLDGDVIRCGRVDIVFCDPRSRDGQVTLSAPEPPPQLHISPAQRRVLIELCRPLRDTPYAVPATNKAIAAELSLGVDAVKTHLRRLAEILSVDRLPRRRSPHGCS